MAGHHPLRRTGRPATSRPGPRSSGGEGDSNDGDEKEEPAHSPRPTTALASRRVNEDVARVRGSPVVLLIVRAGRAPRKAGPAKRQYTPALTRPEGMGTGPFAPSPVAVKGL